MWVTIKIKYKGVKSIIDNLSSNQLTNCLSNILWGELKKYWTSIIPNYKQEAVMREWLRDWASNMYGMYDLVDWWLKSYNRDDLELRGGDYEDISFYQIKIDNGVKEEITCDIEGFDQFLKGNLTTQTLYSINIETDTNQQELIQTLKKLERLD